MRYARIQQASKDIRIKRLDAADIDDLIGYVAFVARTGDGMSVMDDTRVINMVASGWRYHCVWGNVALLTPPASCAGMDDDALLQQANNAASDAAW